MTDENRPDMGALIFEARDAWAVNAADFLQRLADALPVCPTCDGKGWETCAEGAEQCQDCRESGRMDVFRALVRLSELEAALLPKIACNCGFGGFHDDVNPECRRNLAVKP